MSSYQLASQALARWGVEVDDSTLHGHVQQVGAVARKQSEVRVERALEPATRGQVVAEADAQLQGREHSLVIMLDGWMDRQRGMQWGLKPPVASGERVAWHEVKCAIIFRLDQRVDAVRPEIIDKYWVAWRGAIPTNWVVASTQRRCVAAWHKHGRFSWWPMEACGFGTL
jgi:hypothetical protein